MITTTKLQPSASLEFSIENGKAVQKERKNTFFFSKSNKISKEKIPHSKNENNKKKNKFLKKS